MFFPRKLASLLAVALSTAACHHAPAQTASGPGLSVDHPDNPDDAPEEAKTVRVQYTFPTAVLNRDLTKTFTGGFEKPGLKVSEKLVARAHFDVTNTTITGTVTYVKKKVHYQVLDADLVAQSHYDTSMEVDFDVNAQGDMGKATEKDWDTTAVGGKTIELARNILPTNIPVVGPLFLNVHFDLSASCQMKVEGSLRATTGVGVKGDVTMRALYKKDGLPRNDGGKPRKFAFESHVPTFEFAPKPYLNVAGKQDSLHAKCSLSPAAVILVEHAVGAKLSAEPYVEIDAKRELPRRPFTFHAKAGITVVAATDVEVFGRKLTQPHEFTLHDKVFFEIDGAAGAPTLAIRAVDDPGPHPQKRGRKKSL